MGGKRNDKERKEKRRRGKKLGVGELITEQR